VTSPGGPQKVLQSRPRRAYIVLRDGEVIEGGLYLNEGQALAPYLGSRKGGWVNVINAMWLADGESANHAVMQADHIMFAASIDGDIPVFGVTALPTVREVDVVLEDGTRIRGAVHLAEKQRLSDFLTSCGKFLPVLAARRFPADELLGDVAVNSAAVHTVRDASVVAEHSVDSDPATARSDRPSTATPANADVSRPVINAVDLVTEARVPARRIGIPYVAPPSALPQGTPVLAMKDPAAADLTADQRELANWLSRHWLVQLGAGAQLAPPDPRALPLQPTLEAVWHGLAERNAISDSELAIHVASAFKLAVANLDGVTAEALGIIPEKVARKVAALPLRVDGKTLVIAVSDPSSMEIEQQIGFITRQRLVMEIAPPADIRGGLDWHYGPSAGAK
jgi:hypothetical protein